jgi:hypothetical protein
VAHCVPFERVHDGRGIHLFRGVLVGRLHAAAREPEFNEYDPGCCCEEKLPGIGPCHGDNYSSV